MERSNPIQKQILNYLQKIIYQIKMAADTSFQSNAYRFLSIRIKTKSHLQIDTLDGHFS